MKTNVPTCYSGSPILSKLGVYNSTDLIREVCPIIGNKNFSDYKSQHFAIELNYYEVAKWIPTINYNEFWLDGGDMGVMLHPHTYKPVWLNLDALDFCKCIDGKKTIEDILKNNISEYCEIGEEVMSKYVAFVLVLEDLDMLHIKRGSNGQ